ncbi:N-acetylmuramoyl-L-alanine amidase family protein [Lacinutrix algicola]|uniref:N-acetylmuramoyl-L-alanine amidase family protein n=1 Tax=Lacinutrix algicola TaxID=342954 RepID=UPI0006E4201E|nr:N-acetylmuramoyl-L-alanine amidase [Lacinutrix algicola]
MKTVHHILTLFISITFLNTSIAQKGLNESKNRIVIIDPGHGGIDSGAVSINNTKEKDIVLSIASKILVLNNTVLKNPLELYLTRYTDTLVSLGDRTKLAKKLKADVFISIHCNQAINRNAAGTEVYIHPKSEVQAEESAYLGFTIQKGLADLLGIKNRGLKYVDFQVLRDSRKGSATVLLELGFLSQTDEAIYLSKEKSHEAIALVILQSTFKYLGL